MAFIVNYISKKALLTLFLATILVLSAPVPFALASSKSPYESGYDHGCDDAGMSNPSDRYINQPEKGPAYHTSEFMNGYDSGFNSCGSSGNYYEPEQSNNERYSTSNEYTTQNQDEITSFCSALQRGDYRAAEGVLALLGGGSIVAGAEALCAGWNLGAFLDSQGAFN